jgi:hypothetical protein
MNLIELEMAINHLNFEFNEGITFPTLLHGNKNTCQKLIEYSGGPIGIPANKDYGLDCGI